jgi:ubiquinone/menaquinone biosynthesis C-methylase UbiE
LSRAGSGRRCVIADESNESSKYVFDRTEGEEERRLEAQATVIDPLTERLFRDAGLIAGMRVLDLGSGAGDVAMLAARLVGPRGAVVGMESSLDAISTARHRAKQAGLSNVAFVEGDVREPDRALDPKGPAFDAVVGRLVLQFVQEPGDVLRAAASFVRPGGLVCFQECDDWYTWAYPASPLWEQVRGWFLAALEGARVEQRMGLRLYQTFLDAGLPPPQLRLEAPIGGGQNAPAFLWAGVVRSLVPVMDRLGIATPSEVDSETLVDRLSAETLAHNGIAIGLVLVGAWARTVLTERHGE